MKKKLLSIILLVTALIFIGCGADESESVEVGAEVKEENTEQEDDEEEFLWAMEDIEIKDTIEYASGNSNGVDTSSWMMQPPINVVQKSHLELTVGDISLMCDIADMHRRSFDSNKDEITNTELQEAFNNKGCIVYSETLKEGSDWANCFGSATISEVFRAFGYPEYGLEGRCFCIQGANAKEMLSKYGTEDTFPSSRSKLYYNAIPLSSHVFNHLSSEEIEHYLVCTYAAMNDCSEEEAYFSDDLLRDLYGISKDDLVAKYVNYKPATLEDPAYMYTLAREYGGYSGDAISWMNLSQEELDSWVLVTLTNLWNTKKGEGGTINPDVANTITMLGGTVSEN